MMKLRLIKFADWVDDKLLDHRWYGVCERVGLSSWWGSDD